MVFITNRFSRRAAAAGFALFAALAFTETAGVADTGLPTTEGSRRVLSPAADNTYKNRTITEDTTWKGTVLVEGGLVLASQATLTIEPGTTVIFAPSSSGEKAVFLVHGRIQALGGADKPVVFTSSFAEPSKGDWQGIVIMASEKKNSLENCRITGAEAGVEALFSRVTLRNVNFTACGTGARIQDCMAVMVGGGATGCGIGLNLLDTEADVRDAVFSENGQAILSQQSSLYLGGATISGNSLEGIKIQGGRIRIVGNSISDNGSGMTLMECEGTLSGNKILKNSDVGVSLAKARVKATGNDISGNGKVGLRVEDGKGAAWGNTLADNGDYDLYNGGTEDFKAMGNWWGDTPAIERRIYDKRSDSSVGRVLYVPVLQAKPQADL
ncbi:right-handed parallel beta-helix repeat-containing protein [Geotalea sp. SG265]|uniref:right-handed parallel beta-helix repeat-containing protein n=1 Tax=Geotalea sp. SG265 TaxID=2922867 RepID=UPI001FAF8AB6|nr:right-handed parallel beta-helix repeat-containing protein [Geotalea sp. SG265]